MCVQYKKGDIIDAAKSGNVHDIERCILRGASVNEQDGNGFSPLMWASWNGHRAAVDFLIAQDALVNQTTTAGDFALYDAAVNGHHGVCEALIKAGAEPWMKYQGRPIWQWTAEQGHHELAKYLEGLGTVSFHDMRQPPRLSRRPSGSSASEMVRNTRTSTLHTDTNTHIHPHASSW